MWVGFRGIAFAAIFPNYILYIFEMKKTHYEFLNRFIFVISLVSSSAMYCMALALCEYVAPYVRHAHNSVQRKRFNIYVLVIYAHIVYILIR